MPLTAPLWKDNRRIQAAAINAPPMHPNEPDAAAVKLLQRALIDTGALHIGAPTGFYGPQTAEAVRDIEGTFALSVDQGVAGKQVLEVLDLLLQGKRPATGGRSGAALAEDDKPLASAKVNAALAALALFRPLLQAMLNGASVDSPLPVTLPLFIHFKLRRPQALINEGRVITMSDLDNIRRTYQGILNVFGASAAKFRSGTPVHGLTTPAEAQFGGVITFGPAFADFDTLHGGRIGPNSRAAILIHEATHVVDQTSHDPAVHISEFRPEYETQSPDAALHNPSSYAGFAAHIALGHEPTPRFGLGPGARGL